jgi:hypothetical protein
MGSNPPVKDSPAQRLLQYKQLDDFQAQIMARERPYYSIRTGKNPLSAGFDLEGGRELFKHQFVSLEDEGYFQEALGFECVDAGFIPGTIGQSLEGALLIELRKRDLTPIRQKIEKYSEEEIFDIIEFGDLQKPGSFGRLVIRSAWFATGVADAGTAGVFRC